MGGSAFGYLKLTMPRPQQAQVGAIIGRATQRAEALWSLIADSGADWQSIRSGYRAQTGKDPAELPLHIHRSIHRLWRGKLDRRTGRRAPLQAHRRPLLVQLLANAIEPSLNILCIKDQSNLPGNWSVRGPWLQRVIVPFISRHRLESLLGDTPDLYNPTPLKAAPEFHRDTRSRDKEGWLTLCDLLEWLHDNPDKVEPALLVVMRHIYLAREERDAQALPLSLRGLPEIPLQDALTLALDEILQKKWVGEAPIAIVHAMSQLLADSGQAYYDTARRRHAQAADRVGGQLVYLGDVDCLAGSEVKLAQEVKGRELALTDITGKLSALDTWMSSRKGLLELRFISQGVQSSDEMAIKQHLDRAADRWGIRVTLEADLKAWVVARLQDLDAKHLEAFAQQVRDSLSLYSTAERAAEWDHVLEEAVAAVSAQGSAMP